MRRYLVILLAFIPLTACQLTARSPRVAPNPVCAEVRLNSAFELLNRAKDYFQSYYKTRKENELFYAYYASEDSAYMANSVKSCFDKKNKHFYAVQNLLRKNRTIQRLIAQNMRQTSQAKLSELYMEDYRQIFVRDIQ